MSTDFERGRGEGILEILHQQARGGARWRDAADCVERVAIQSNRAACSGLESRERVQRQRLARAVAPEDGDELAGRELHRQLAHELARAAVNRKPVCGEQRSVSCRHGCRRVDGPRLSVERAVAACLQHSRPAHAVMHAAVALHPQLHGVGPKAKTAPVWRPRNGYRDIACRLGRVGCAEKRCDIFATAASSAWREPIGWLCALAHAPMRLCQGRDAK